MKRPDTTVALAIVLLSKIAAPGLTKDVEPPATTSPSDAQNVDQDVKITGLVQNVYPATDTLKIKVTEGNVRTVTVDSESTIIRNGVKIDWSALIPGDIVTIQNPQNIM